MAKDIVTQIVVLDTTSEAEDLSPNITRQTVAFLTPDGQNAMKLQAEVMETIMAAIADHEDRIAALEA